MIKKRILCLLSAVALLLSAAGIFCLSSCGEEEATEGTPGLVYRLNDDLRSYTCIGKGESREQRITVASHYGKDRYPVTAIGVQAFRDSDIVSVTLPSTVETVGNAAFYDCKLLEEVILSNGVESIGTHSFFGCNVLTSLSLPESLVSIGDYAFLASGLIHVSLPRGLKSVAFGAFSDCASLKDVYIPKSVKTMGNYVFSGSMALENIRCEGSQAPSGWGEKWAENCPETVTITWKAEADT